MGSIGSFKAKGIYAGYGREPLLKDVEINLEKGEILTLIGPNGSGKSTLLKSISGQLSLLGGTVFLGKDDLLKLRSDELARKRAVLFTSSQDPLYMTCFDTVSAGRYPYTGRFGKLTDLDREKVREALLLTETLELADVDVRKISDGQRQRVLLARALCQEPGLLILDEPTAYLDIHHKLKFLSVLKKLAGTTGVIVIMALHELDLAQKISDRVMCIKDGAVIREGTPEEVFAPGCIEELFSMKDGEYSPYFGSVELAAPAGEPKVFVIGGGGSAVSTYRYLQRKQISFATGILQRGDVDHEAARMLAESVVSIPSFTYPSDDVVEEAAALMSRTGKVICTVDTFTEQNDYNRKLFELAKSRGILTGKAAVL